MAVLLGTAANDTLVGTANGDTLNGLAGADKMSGGGGSDTYIIDQAGDVATEVANQGSDLVRSSVSLALGLNLETLELLNGAITGTGNAQDNTIFGNSANNTLDGGGGRDVIQGGVGNDKVIGGAGNDLMSGGDGTDWLQGGAGDDFLNGGALPAFDKLEGGAGNDSYFVQNVSTQVIELAGQGTDTINSLVSIDLSINAVNVENLNLLVLNGFGIGNALNNEINGSFGNDLLTGLGGNDTLNGSSGNDQLTAGTGNDLLRDGDGIDTLRGGLGNDIYLLTDNFNTIEELAGEGTDEVRTEMNTFNLFGLAIEKLTFLGNANSVGVGNTLANVIVGNIGKNDLSGDSGNDTLIGGLGNDTLTGGFGNDAMSGGKDDDKYFVDSVADKVTENANEGIDTVTTFIANYALGANVENLVLSNGGLNGTGNALNNVIVGNADANKLDGGSGNDKLSGDGLSDSLTGGAGDDTLDGGTGNDTMKGGLGNDVYTIDAVADIVAELAGQGTDEIRVTGDYDLNVANGANIENLTLTGAVNTEGIGNALSNLIQGTTGNNILQGRGGNDTLLAGDGSDELRGNEGNDVLDGGTGSNTLIGGIGNDVYVIGVGTDAIQELVGEGTDEVRASVTVNLGLAQFANIEKLTLTGSANIGGTGNALANVLTGNDGGNGLAGGIGNDTLTGGGGSDTLDGGDGNDVMTGGKGEDIYAVNSALDKVTESKDEGFDSVRTVLSSYTLGANLEMLEFEDAAGAATGSGNELANLILGNVAANTINGLAGDDSILGYGSDDTLNGGAGDDHLEGGAGIDVLVGGAGNDTYVLDGTADKITEAAGQGIDTINTNTSFDLTTQINIENVTLYDAANVNVTGNALNNIITGNSGVNLISGGGGNDQLDGLGGNDNISGGSGNDTVQGGADNDAMSGDAGDDQLDGGSENDTLLGGIGNDALSGGIGNDTLSGDDGNDTLDGGAGDDQLQGGLGNDLYMLAPGTDTVLELANQGTDEVRSAVGINLAIASLVNIENATLIGFKDFNVIGNGLANILTGNEGENELYGNDGDDSLAGGGGKDYLDGGIGKDTMSGGKGNEIYIVDDVLDKIIEAADEGDDLVVSTVSYTLSANVESLFLDAANINGTGNALDNRIDGTGGINQLDGAAGNDSLFGNGSDDTLIGGAGNDTLDGGAGNDSMNGGLGDDTYKVDSLNDKVTELAGQGNDTIVASINLDLTKHDNVENLSYSGAADFVGLGNALNNGITGGIGNDLLDGDAGNDSLTGGTNNDFLVGNIGDDVLDGGVGNDTLEGGAGNDVYVLAGTDTVLEDPNQGIDEVRTEQNFSLFTAPLANIENLRLTGSGDFTAEGNDLDNVITGNSGSNHLSGGAGNDTVNGGAGDDTISGGTGGDVMAGGTGDDTYLVGSAADKITELAGEGIDTVYYTTLGAYTLGANLENLVFEDVASTASGTGNALNNAIDGNSSANKLDGQAGNDELFGGGGIDTLLGGAGNDNLNGGSGADIMNGGAGNDFYTVDDGSDQVQEAANGGIDTVETFIDFTIANGSNIENLNLLAGRKGFGNDSNNVITGSASADTIQGNKGHDSLFGNGGDDGISGGEGNDLIEGGLGVDSLEGGIGNDVFLYRLDNVADLATLAGDFISGFEVGKDRIDLLDLFSDFGIISDDPFGDGYLRLLVNGGDTLVQFDSNGGANSFVTLATLQGVTTAAPSDLIFPAPATNEIL